MAIQRIKTYKLGWSFRHNRGMFAAEVQGTGWSRPIPLGSPAHVAAIGAILRSDAAIWWDTEGLALYCGDRVEGFAADHANAATEQNLLGGDGPFPEA